MAVYWPDKQLPATITFFSPCGSRDRNGIVYQVPTR
jgi:hypothetical protein